MSSSSVSHYRSHWQFLFTLTRRCLGPFTAITYFAHAIPKAIRIGGIPPRHFLRTAVFRIALLTFQPRQIQVLAPPSAKSYDMWLGLKRRDLRASGNEAMLGYFQKRVDRLWDAGSSDGSILWLGDPDKASKFVLFLHGGGYIAPLTPGHVEWCYQAYVLPSIAAGSKTPDVAVAILQYTLCPVATYPTQLRQSCRALSNLLTHMEKRNISPSTSLIIGGDSAGGNLATLVVRHILVPHPGIEPLALPRGESLAGVFLVSPFVDSRTDTASFREHNGFDMISDALIKKSVAGMIQPRDDLPDLSVRDLTALAVPLQGDMSTWLGKVDTVVKSLYVTAGEQEVFRDQIVQFVDEARKQCPELELRFELTDKEVHDYILVEAVTKKFAGATSRMRDWAVEVLALQG